MVSCCVAVWMLGFGDGLDAWLWLWLWRWFGCLALALAVFRLLGFGFGFGGGLDAWLCFGFGGGLDAWLHQTPQEPNSVYMINSCSQ